MIKVNLSKKLYPMKRRFHVAMLFLCLSLPFVACHCADNKTNKNNDATNAVSPKETVVIPEQTCLDLLNRLYNDYLFGAKSDQLEKVVDELFTAKAKQKLLDAYDYDCDGVCYAFWELRTNAQDGKGNDEKNGVEDIWHLVGNAYGVYYSDMGWRGSTLFLFAMDNGAVKIDDYRRKYDESAAEYGSLNHDWQEVVVSDEGILVGTFLFTDGDRYIVEEQDYAEVPVAGHHVTTMSAEAGEGVVYTFRTKVNVREFPTTNSAVVAVMPSVEEDMEPETFPCLGKEDGWFKISINDKVGYVREDLVTWCYINMF